MRFKRRAGNAKPHRRTTPWLRLALLVVLLGFIVVTVWVLRTEPRTTLAIQLTTESVQIRVVASDPAAFVLPRVTGDSKSTCREHLRVLPDAGSTVSYRRVGDEALSVEVKGAAVVETVTNRSGEIERSRAEHPAGVKYTLGKGACPKGHASVVRLPVNGEVSFGEAQAYLSSSLKPSALLLSGELSVFARAMPSLFGIDLSVRPFRANALYLGRTMAIPAGSVIDNSLVDAAAGARAVAPRWSGFADVDLSDGDHAAAAMHVRASANTARVRIYLPSPSTDTREGTPAGAEEVALTMLARLEGDPNLQLLYGVIGAFALLLSACAAIGDLFKQSEAGDAK